MSASAPFPRKHKEVEFNVLSGGHRKILPWSRGLNQVANRSPSASGFWLDYSQAGRVERSRDPWGFWGRVVGNLTIITRSHGSSGGSLIALKEKGDKLIIRRLVRQWV